MILIEIAYDFLCVEIVPDLSELGITELPVSSICQAMMFDMQIIQCCISCVYHHAIMEL
jgi:hypothetical protein